MSPLLTRALEELPTSCRILDAGGWFQPAPIATDVVDLMPYETRGGCLRPDPLPAERFCRATWHQVNFLEPSLHLPFADHAFDFSICSQTIEDLSRPEPLLRELRRVSKAGCIECPSRLAEQTIGVRDRIMQNQGHPHHHWIVEATSTVLDLSAKQDSLAPPSPETQIPLRRYERIVAAAPGASCTTFLWHQSFEWRLIPREEARARARRIVAGLRISRAERLADQLVRRLRGWKWRLLRARPPTPESWWQDAVRLSRPYSSIPL